MSNSKSNAGSSAGNTAKGSGIKRPTTGKSTTTSTKGVLAETGVVRAKGVLEQLMKDREEYLAYVPRGVTPQFTADRRVRRSAPAVYRPNAYLFISGYRGDDGRRPFLGRIRWQSPDVQITHASNPLTPLTVLKAGQSYRIRCTVRNQGDRIVPSAKVEIWLGNQGAGRTTSLARHLTAGQVPTVWVNPAGTAVAEFTYTVTAQDVGQKSLLVRVFSFAPKEIPVDLVNLDPMADRHIAEFQVTINP